jgi:hypothetical protein
MHEPLKSGAQTFPRRDRSVPSCSTEDYATALRIDEQRRKAGGGRSARSGEAEDAAAALIKAVYRPNSPGVAHQLLLES